MGRTVVERRSLVARSLSRALSSDFVVVAFPDHPLVMRSVDVLVGGRSGLTALMMSSALEMRKPAAFQARLALNKAAFPSHTRFVYVAGEDEDGAPTHADAFSEIVSFSDRSVAAKELASLAMDSGASRPSTTSPDRAMVEARFGATLRLAFALAGAPAGPEDVNRRRSSRKPAFDTLPGGVEAAFFRNPPTLPAVAALLEHGANRWFKFDDGRVTPTTAIAGAVFADGFPTYRGDPGKAVRAAAFAGWVLVPARPQRSANEVAELVIKYARTK